MTSRDQRMLDLLLQWPACGTWGYEETLESEDDKLQALFWQLHNEFTNIKGPIRLSPWLQSVIDAGSNADDSYLPINVVHELRNTFPTLAHTRHTRTIAGNADTNTTTSENNDDLNDSSWSGGSRRTGTGGDTSAEDSTEAEGDLTTLSSLQGFPVETIFGDVDLAMVDDYCTNSPDSEHGAQVPYNMMCKRQYSDYASSSAAEDSAKSPSSASGSQQSEGGSNSDGSSEAEGDAAAIAQQALVINLNSPPSSITPFAQSKPSAISQALPVHQPIRLKAPAAPHGWNPGEHDEHLLMDFRKIVCDRCFSDGFWCTYFVKSALEVDRRHVLACEHCKRVRKTCAHQRAQLPPIVRDAAAFGTLLITKRWSYKQQFIPTCSIITPDGQPKEYHARTLVTGALTDPIMYNGTGLQQFTVEVPISRVASQHSSSSKRSRTATHSPHFTEGSVVSSTSTHQSPLFRSMDNLPPTRDPSQEINTVRILASQLQALALAYSVNVDELEGISERLDVVHETLVTSQAEFSADRISFAQYVHNL